MKFNLPITESLPEVEFRQVQVGDIYPAKGGAKTRFWIVLAISYRGHLQGEMVHMIGLNSEGEIVATTSYGRHAIEGTPDGLFKPRQLLGRVTGMSDLQFDIEWKDKP